MRPFFNATMQALLHATDAQDMMVWDENHRNGQDGEEAVLGCHNYSTVLRGMVMRPSGWSMQSMNPDVS